MGTRILLQLPSSPLKDLPAKLSLQAPVVALSVLSRPDMSHHEKRVPLNFLGNASFFVSCNRLWSSESISFTFLKEAMDE